MSTRIFTLLFCATSLFGQETALELDPAQTHVDFTVGSTLHTVHGSFQLMRGNIHYDLASGTASGEIVIDAKSGQSGNDSRDKKMHKDILESQRYPEIVFIPDRVEGSLAEARVHGTIKIHGQDHELTLPVRAGALQEQINITTHFAIPYIQWGMKNPSTLFLRVNDKVEIEIRAVGRKPAS